MNRTVAKLVSQARPAIHAAAEPSSSSPVTQPGAARSYFSDGRGTASVEESSMTKQREITVETDSLLILRGGIRGAPGAHCAAEGEMIALEDAGIISKLERPA